MSPIKRTTLTVLPMRFEHTSLFSSNYSTSSTPQPQGDDQSIVEWSKYSQDQKVERDTTEAKKKTRFKTNQRREYAHTRSPFRKQREIQHNCGNQSAGGKYFVTFALAFRFDWCVPFKSRFLRNHDRVQSCPFRPPVEKSRNVRFKVVERIVPPSPGHLF